MEVQEVGQDQREHIPHVQFRVRPPGRQEGTPHLMQLVVFTDRAQGFTLYDDSLLVNIDRLAGDDYKGVGEGYSFLVHNTFRFKIGLLAKNDFSERLWQRKYDEALLGFV